MFRRPVAFASLAVLGALLACGSQQRAIRIPDTVVKDPKGRARAPKRAGEPYVVKMSDGQRTWQIEIPAGDGTPSFEAAIPLDLGDAVKQPPAPPETEADREIIDKKREKGEPVVAPDAGPPRSYLATLARVRELYKRRQYELGLIDLVELDRAYPDDERILEMKGTLYKKLQRQHEAREAWERVLVLNPSNRAVARALEQLLEETAE